MRNILVHCHLFKNAGSSVDYSLRESFGDRLGYLEGPYPWSIIRQEDLISYIKEHPSLQAITSHQARILQLVDGDISIHPLVFLRHPLDRIRSIYEFDRVQGNITPSAVMASTSTLKEYVEWRLSEELISLGMHNFQVVSLSHAPYDAPDPQKARATPAYLEQAKAFLAALPSFGIVECFDDSIEKLNRWLQPIFPQLTLTSQRLNVTRTNNMPLEARVDQLRADLGHDLFDRVVEANQYDLALYQFAQERFIGF